MSHYNRMLQTSQVVTSVHIKEYMHECSYQHEVMKGQKTLLHYCIASPLVLFQTPHYCNHQPVVILGCSYVQSIHLQNNDDVYEYTVAIGTVDG